MACGEAVAKDGDQECFERVVGYFLAHEKPKDSPVGKARPQKAKRKAPKKKPSTKTKKRA
jgi:hypothetical protein